MDTGLKDKHILITGASGGIGLACAEVFASEANEGLKLSLHFNQNEQPVKEFKKKHKKLEISIYKADLRFDKEVKELFKNINEKMGRIDILIVNHGIWPKNHSLIHDLPISQFTNTMNTNLISSFLCSKYFMKQLIDFQDEEAAIVFIGSTAGVFGEAGHVDYSVSKFAIMGLVKSLKNEIVHVARAGRVNIVSPGWTNTPMTEEFMDNHESIKTALQTMPLRKIAKPEDIANSVLFLSSSKLAGHISGQNIVVAGGMEGRLLFEKEEININRI